MSDERLFRCAACGATNRITPKARPAGARPVCGRCKAPLDDLADVPRTVTDATFAAEVERSPLPVLVDAWASWCAPCRMIAPVIDELAREMAGRVRMAKLDVDQNPGTASRFGLRSIPTLLVFDGGREVDRLVGVQPKDEIVRRLQGVLARRAS